MTHVRGEDEGVYICRASNALGEAVTTASMKIRSKILIYIHKISSLLLVQHKEMPEETVGNKFPKT
jgi:hypothetical protein